MENKKKVLEYDLEGVRLALQKENQEKFEAQIVLNNLRDFSQRIEEIPPAEKHGLLQSLVKRINYGKERIDIEIFYLPENSFYVSATQPASHANQTEADSEGFAWGRSNGTKDGGCPRQTDTNCFPIILPNTIHKCCKFL